MKQFLHVRYRFSVVATIVLLSVALLSLGGARVILAAITASGSVPETMTYQGVLTNSSGPYTGTTQIVFSLYEQETGGSSIWQETHASVPVNNGFFSVVLGSQGQPMAGSLFSGPERWLQVATDLGSGPVTLPRQRLHAVPYALQAYTANHATTADTVLNPPAYVGSPHEYVVTVAKSGGDYTSVVAALNSITNASANSPWLVWIAPGTYVETDLVNVPSYVQVRGAGRGVTKIVGTRSHTFANNPQAAIVQLNNHSRISDLSIYNNGASQNSTGVLVVAGATLSTIMENITVNVTTTGGTVHTGVSITEAAATIRNATIIANGAGTYNTGLNSYVASTSGPFQTSVIENSRIRGEGNVGYGLQLSSSTPVIKESEIFGGLRGIWTTGDGGVTVVKDSLLEIPVVGANLPDSILFETLSGAGIDVFGSQLEYSNADPASRHTGNNLLRCLDNYLRHQFFPYLIFDLVDGLNSVTACTV